MLHQIDGQLIISEWFLIFLNLRINKYWKENYIKAFDDAIMILYLIVILNIQYTEENDNL